MSEGDRCSVLCSPLTVTTPVNNSTPPRLLLVLLLLPLSQLLTITEPRIQSISGKVVASYTLHSDLFEEDHLLIFDLESSDSESIEISRSLIVGGQTDWK